MSTLYSYENEQWCCKGRGVRLACITCMGVFPWLFLRLLNLTAVWNYSQSEFQAYRNVDFLPLACLLVPLLVLVFNIKLILIQRLCFKSTVGLYTSYCTYGGKIYIQTTNLILQGLMYRPYNILLILFHYYCIIDIISLLLLTLVLIQRLKKFFLYLFLLVILYRRISKFSVSQIFAFN